MMQLWNLLIKIKLSAWIFASPPFEEILGTPMAMTNFSMYEFSRSLPSFSEKIYLAIQTIFNQFIVLFNDPSV